MHEQGRVDLGCPLTFYPIMEQLAEEVLNRWVESVNAKDPEALLSMYAASAVLLPTFSSEIRSDLEGIRGYFLKIAQSDRIEVSIHQDSKAVQQLTDNLYSLFGLYTWQIEYAGSRKSFNARYTFLVDVASDRPILHHHSSLLPES